MLQRPEPKPKPPPPSAVVDSWGEVLGGEASGDVDVGAGLGGDRGALISQLVCPFVLLDADVGGDPLDEDSDGEVADVLFKNPGEFRVMAGLPAEGEDAACKLAVGEDVELLVGVVGVGADAVVGCLECKTDRPEFPQVVGALAQRSVALCLPPWCLVVVEEGAGPAPQGPGFGLAEPSVKATRLWGRMPARSWAP